MMNEAYIIMLLKKLSNLHAILSTNELEYLKGVFDSYEGKVYIEGIMQQEWKSSEADETAANFDRLYAKIQTLIAQKRGNGRTISFKAFIRTTQRVAAVLLLPLLLGMLILAKPYWERRPQLTMEDFETVAPFEQEYYIPAGTKSKIILPDSSFVWLNSNSRLIVESNYGKALRRVRLSGEAYFEVAHNDDAPFEISTHEMDVRVLGTIFNLSAYPNDMFVEAVLVEGSIEVNTGEYAQKNVKKTRLQPAQRFALDKTNYKVQIDDNVATDLYTAWKDNLLVYNNTSITDVAKSLERWFNVTFIVKDKELTDFTFTGKFEDRSLEQILHFIQISSPIAYNVKKDTVTINIEYKQ